MGRPTGLNYEQIDGQRHRAMSRAHERLLNRELLAIRAVEAKERKADETWLMPEALYKRLAAIQEWLVRIPPARKKNQELLDAANATLPTEQLEAIVRRELAEGAASWTEEQWALVDAERAKKQPGRWVPEGERT